MYNPYLSQSWQERVGAAPPPGPQTSEGEKPGLAGLLRSLRLESLDTGDVLLLLILLFLFLDDPRENGELLLTLGLMLLL